MSVNLVGLRFVLRTIDSGAQVSQSPYSDLRIHPVRLCRSLMSCHAGMTPWSSRSGMPGS
jgi:hypothetical protein